jgi:hypothetical protein
MISGGFLGAGGEANRDNNYILGLWPAISPGMAAGLRSMSVENSLSRTAANSASRIADQSHLFFNDIEVLLRPNDQALGAAADARAS